MNSPFTTTFLFGIVAAVLSAGAVYFFPWPEPDQLNERINQPLFEEYEFSRVRSLEIVSFNRDREAVDRIKLRRSGEKWVIPAKNNFVVTNVDQVARAVNSLKACTILGMETDEQEDQIEFGVVDPEEAGSATNRTSLGSKIVLKDRNQKLIASLIVGKNLKGDDKRFARITGEPMVYVTDYDVTALASEFASFVDPNLFKLATPTNPVGHQPARITVDRYQIATDAVTVGKKKRDYKVTFEVKDNRMGPTELLLPNETGELENVDLKTPKLAPFASLGNYVTNVLFTDVESKGPELTKAVREQKEDVDDKVFSSLTGRGFHKTGYADGGFVFNSTAGSVQVGTQTGMLIDLYIGNIAISDTKLKRYAMIQARPDLKSVPEIEKPADADPKSEANKIYLRAVEERDKALEIARNLVKEFNRINAKWYYVVDEDAIEGLMPNLGAEKKAPSPAGAGLLARPTDENPDDAKPDSNDEDK